MVDICKAQPPYRYGVRTLSSKDIGIISKPVIPEPVVVEPQVVNEDIITPTVFVDATDTIEPEAIEIPVAEVTDIEEIKDGLTAFSKKSAQALEINGITTVAQLQAYLAEGKTLEELPKIGPKLEQTILEELEKITK